MIVTIPIPSRCISVKEKRDFVEEIIRWGEENLEDQDNWRYKAILLRSNKFPINANTSSIGFSMDEDADGMAVKLAWCEG